jgi:hypothetical protein
MRLMLNVCWGAFMVSVFAAVHGIVAPEATGQAPARAPVTLSDAEAFRKIVQFWRREFPNSSLEVKIRTSGGPDAKRLRVDVPVALEDYYRRPFAKDFLLRQRVAKDALTRNVAEDLLLLRLPILSRHKGVSISYPEYKPPFLENGFASDSVRKPHYVECVMYVVQSE